MADRKTALDGLRGLAATSVIFYHAILHKNGLVNTVLIPPIQALGWHGLPTKLALSIANGNTAILLFFVMSGFVLRQSLDRSAGDFPVIAANFIIRRIFRLYPALIACMLGFLVLAALYKWLGWTGMPNPDFAAVAKNASLVVITWHGPSTTIQSEMLAVPFILMAFLIAQRFGTPGMICGVAFSFFAFDAPQLVLWAPNMHSYLSPFMVGMLVADKNMKQMFEGTSSTGLAVLCFAFFLLRMFVGLGSIAGAIAETMLAGGLVGSVSYGATRSIIVRALNSGPLQFLGRISYSLYLWNVLGLFIAWAIVDPTDLYSAHGLATGLLVGLIVTIATIPIAVMSQRIFEEGGVRLGRYFTIRRRTSAAMPFESHPLWTPLRRSPSSSHLTVNADIAVVVGPNAGDEG